MAKRDPGGRPRKLPKTPLVVRLGTLDELKATLARILGHYGADELPETKARTLIYGLRAGLDVLAAERDGDLERRIAKLEELLHEPHTV